MHVSLGAAEELNARFGVEDCDRSILVGDPHGVNGGYILGHLDVGLLLRLEAFVDNSADKVLLGARGDGGVGDEAPHKSNAGVGEGRWAIVGGAEA